MALSNAEKQARHRARRDAEVGRLRGEIAALRDEVEALRADNAALEAELAREKARPERGRPLKVVDGGTVTIRSKLYGVQKFRRVGRSGGVKLRVSVWRGECVICGEDFAADQPGVPMTCPAHRLSKSECSRIGGRASLARRRSELEKIKARMLARGS